MTDRQWKDVPTANGWHWIRPLEHDGVVYTELLQKNPCRVYWSAKGSHWRFDHPWGSGYDAVRGRQVCPIQGPPE